MDNNSYKKLKLLETTEKLSKAIDDEIDWYIASFIQKDPNRRALARSFFFEKQLERLRLAKEAYERSK